MRWLRSGAIKASRVIDSGRVCNCAERVFVTRVVADEFISKMTAAMAATRYGDLQVGHRRPTDATVSRVYAHPDGVHRVLIPRSC